MLLKTTTAYTIRRDEGDRTFWKLKIQNVDAAEGYDLGPVLAVARARLGSTAVLEVWDENRGEFTSELVADERV